MRPHSLLTRQPLGRHIRALMGVWFLFSGCAQEEGPEAVAIEYARALYASDPARVYRLISSEDRRVKPEAAFVQERGAVSGFALEVTRQLASFIGATPVEKTIREERATVRLKLRLPDANAPDIVALVHEWDERRLNALSRAEREEITRKLNQLHRAQKIPMLEGIETFELARERSGWRVFLNWAGGVRVRFSTAMGEALPLQATVSPEEVLVTPGERVRVTVRAKNLSPRDIVVRVGHRTEPKAQADSLALLQCPLFVPVTLEAGQSEEFISEYVLLKDVPLEAKQFQVTYEFFLKQDEGLGAKPR